MPKVRVRVVFLTPPVPVKPKKKDPFANCPHTRSDICSRHFQLDYNKLWVQAPRNKIKFYGDEYEISSLGLNHKAIGIRVSKDQMDRLLAKAKEAGHRWKVDVRNMVDATRVLPQIPL